MMVFKRKQIVVLSLVLMIVVAGYIQYNYKKSSIATSGKDSGKLGEAVYVGTKDSGTSAGKSDSNTKTPKSSDASQKATDYFTQARLDKQITQSKDNDVLKEIADDTNSTKEVRAMAQQEIIKIVNNTEKEMKIETLVKQKEFEDVLALFGEDGSLDIVVKSPNLTSAQTAQIVDIVTRQAKVPVLNIQIKNIY